VTAVERLRGDIGIPGRLRELGVRPEQLRPFAEKAFAIKRILRVNPRPVTADDLEGDPQGRVLIGPGRSCQAEFAKMASIPGFPSTKVIARGGNGHGQEKSQGR
jgi:hypothetical protein